MRQNLLGNRTTNGLNFMHMFSMGQVSGTKPKKIALVDDEQNILDLLEIVLTEDGLYEVTKYKSGLFAMKEIPKKDFDAAILDLNLIDISGKSVIESIRSVNKTLPIIMLTANQSEAKLAECLDSGADDYITKPFDKQVLHARLKARLRRSGAAEFEQKNISHKHIEIDLDKVKVYREGKEIILTATEFKLLVHLMRNQERVLSRSNILEAVWGHDNDSQSRLIDVHISNLRKKINESFQQELPLVETIRGFGYRILGD